MLRRHSAYRAKLKMFRRDIHFLLFPGQTWFAADETPGPATTWSDLRKHLHHRRTDCNA